MGTTYTSPIIDLGLSPKTSELVTRSFDCFGADERRYGDQALKPLGQFEGWSVFFNYYRDGVVLTEVVQESWIYGSRMFVYRTLAFRSGSSRSIRRFNWSIEEQGRALLRYT